MTLREVLRLDGRIDKHEARTDKHDERLRALETFAAKVGVCAMLGSIVGGGIVTLLVNFLSKGH